MKQTLRMLCMGLAAATSLAGFAQEPQNFTGKLWNYDFEKGPHGWDITAESGDQYYNCWMPQTKGFENVVGYHGYNNLALENWKGAGSGLKDNSASQIVTGLPNGTYVFGAYMAATNDSWEPSIDVIEGVYIFAGDSEEPVATHRVEGMDEKWAHSIKFNVATVVENGALKVGVKCVATNASFVTMDNATLWYFGDMSKEDALNAMAKIDLAASAAIADTCVATKMNVDTLAYLKDAIAAGRAITKAEDAAQLDENIWWGIRLSKKSVAAYSALAEAVAAAKAVRDMQWSDYANTVAALDALKTLIGEAETMYSEAKTINVEIDTMVMDLEEASALLQLDSCYILGEMYETLCDEMPTSGEAGEYTEAMQEQVETLIDEVFLELDAVAGGEASAIEAKAYCEKRFAQIQQILDNPVAFAQFPIVIPRDTTVKLNNMYLLQGATLTSQGYATFTSPLYRFDEPLTRIRFTLKENGGNKMCGNYPFTSLATFHLFDENNNKIELTEENIVCNADHNALGGNDGQGIIGMLDDDPNTYFHTSYSTVVNEYHYIEVTLPEDEEYTAFSFTITARPNSGLTDQFPAVLDIRYVSDIITDLQKLVAEVDGINPAQGTSVGFYNTDVNVYYQAIEEAKALIAADYANDDDVQAAIDNLNAAVETLKESFVLPVAEKKYRIVSSESSFYENQGVHKAMTIYEGDSLKPNWLWWEDAHPDSVKQVFSFEFIGEANDKLYYAIKHDVTGKYLADWYDADGVRPLDNAVFTLAENPDSFELRSLGAGEFAIGREGYSHTYMHMLNHNSGVADPNASAQAGVGQGKGISSSIITWVNAAFDDSGWYIVEMATLPTAVETESDELFKSKLIYLYSKVNQLVLTADKDCAFDDLKVYDMLGEEQTFTVVKNGATATIVLDVAMTSFSFSFANAEGVASVKVEGALTTKSDVTKLQKAYDAAIAISVVEGDEVGQVSDLSAYNKAVAAAEEILLLGGSDDVITKTIEDLNAAVDGITYNLPSADKNYFIQSALPWKERWNSEMDVFVKDNVESDNVVYWSYVNIRNLNHQWQFVDCGQLKNGMPAYYLKNVGTELYLTTPRLEGNGNGGRLYVVEDTTEAAPFNIHFLSDGKVAIGDSREGNANGGWCLHPMNHQTGTGYVAHGYMISWGKGDAASAMRILSAEQVVADFMTGIEDVEIAEEQVAPAVKGIYDLYGRRIETPTATGIYIVDGKKHVIKK